MAMRQERRALLRQAVKEVTARGISPRQGIWGTIGATRILLDVLEGGSQQRWVELRGRRDGEYGRGGGGPPSPPWAPLPPQPDLAPFGGRIPKESRMNHGGNDTGTRVLEIEEGGCIFSFRSFLNPGAVKKFGD